MWYEKIGRSLVAQYVFAYYQPGVQSRSLKYCWRRLCRDTGYMNFHTFLRYARETGISDSMRLP